MKQVFAFLVATCAAMSCSGQAARPTSRSESEYSGQALNRIESRLTHE